MKCKTCNASLSIQNIEKNIWIEDIEEFVFVCPVCKTETKLISCIFDEGHISKSYLEMILLDCDKKEKQTDYIPVEQRKRLFEHINSCKHCNDMLESMRLKKISNEIVFNKNLYEFFLTKSVCITNVCKVEVQNSSKKFKIDNKDYIVYEKDLFYQHENISCYLLEENLFNLGMVSFLECEKEVILDRIWVKSNERVLKEKKFLHDLKLGEIKVLVDLVNKYRTL